MKHYFTMFLAGFMVISHGQIAINTATPDPSSILHIESNSKGVVFPRLTKIQRDDIIINATHDGFSVPGGLTVYCTDCCYGGSGSLYFYNESKWIPFHSGCEITCIESNFSLVNANHIVEANLALLTDSFTTEATQPNNNDLRLHHDGEDIVNIKFPVDIFSGSTIEIYWSDNEDPGNLGMKVEMKNNGVDSQSMINTFTNTLPNSTNVSNGSNDFILTISITSAMDEIIIQSHDDNIGEDPQFYEIVLKDSDGTIIPLSGCN